MLKKSLIILFLLLLPSVSAQFVVSPDFNDDNMVNLEDLILFAQNFGTQNAVYNLDGQGTVDLADLIFFSQVFGCGPTTCPVVAVAPTEISRVPLSAGFRHSLVVKPDGSVWAWGRNVEGELGDRTTTNRNSPVLVRNLIGGLTDIKAVSAGRVHSLALGSDGKVWAWGKNNILGGSRASRYGSAGLQFSRNRYRDKCSIPIAIRIRFRNRYRVGPRPYRGVGTPHQIALISTINYLF